MKHENPWRLSLLGVMFSFVGFAIMVQLVRIQVGPEADAFRKQGDSYLGIWRTVYPPRGQIYDRWGNLLAGNKTVYEVGVDLVRVRKAENAEDIAFALMAILGKDYNEMLARLSQPVHGESQASEDPEYLFVADFVPAEKVLQLKKLAQEVRYRPEKYPSLHTLTGLVFNPHLQRSYPEKDLASNILGFVIRDGTGVFGVEQQYGHLLAGNPETIWIPQDPNRVDEMPEIPPGTSLVLTIDREIQASIESILDEAVEKNGAESGTILVLDPKTGEILGMATSSRIDLNEYWTYTDVISGTTPFNQAIGKAYEPGSVFKVLTMSAALDRGAVTPQTEFLDTGVFEIGGAQIYNWDKQAWGPQTMSGCMENSLNVCLAWVASKLGADDFYQAMTAFGLGHTTGIDLAGEASGRLKTPGDADWFTADLGTNAFGQGVSVTPIQMIAAVSALANDGKMMVPHVLRSMIDNGHQYDLQPQLAGVPISAGAARKITKMLAQTIENEASTARVRGYHFAGKTGTAEIPTPYGYTSNRTNTSFVGWGPVDDPQFVVYIWLEKPTTSIWGSEVAAPVFRRVAERLVVLMNIPSEAERASMLDQ